MSNTDSFVNIAVPVAVVGGGSYALNRLGVPYILGVPISGTVSFFLMAEEGFRRSNTGGPYTLYEWYIESTLLGVDVQKRHYIKSYEERTGLKYDK